MKSGAISKGLPQDAVLPVMEKTFISETPEYTVENVEAGGGRFYLFIKRCFDIFASLLAGIVLLVPMLVIAILVRLDSPGPALFRQERLGKDGVPFTIYKFRSMYIDAEANGPQWAKRNDSRCARLGRFLRNTRLDELPQLLNILSGKMSIVGPRPERDCFYDEFETYIHGFRNRLVVKPGLTGYAQVNGGYELKPEEKIIYDMEYIQNRSVKMDGELKSEIPPLGPARGRI